jgi:hypothetical protein
MAINIELRTESDMLLSPETKAHIVALQCLVQAGNDSGALNDEVTKSLEEQINIVMNGIAEDRYKEGKLWWKNSIKKKKGIECLL